jgi:NADPH-dependent 2,4-dienoyl-CoA reductase/sulfur reductase-like enzyme/rhodanese-related sulfurtransferase
MSLRIVIVGGVAAGMSAATRARRLNENASIVVLEKNGYISFANCGLPYYINRRIPHADKLLVTTPQKVKARFNIDARVRHEVTAIDRAGKAVRGIDHSTGLPFVLPYDKLILAPGAAPVVPPIENVRSANVFLLRSVEDTLALDKWLSEKKPKRCVIVGAGFIGLEMAEAMHDRGLEVTVVEKATHALPPLDIEMAGPLHAELASHGVKLVAGVGLKAVQVRDGLVNSVELEDGRRIETDFVLLSIGVRPNVQLAKDAGLAIGASGAIAVDSFHRTNDPDIYAVGDAAEITHGVTGLQSRIPLAGPANRQGRLAGEHAATGDAAPAPSILGTAIVQVFGLSIGMTGLSQTQAQAQGIAADAAYVFPPNHATYYPGAQNMRLKLVYAPDTGRILGAQAVGGLGVDKRIDVIATAIHFKGTIHDLASLDLAYAPQFASARDPVHHAAMVAQNQLRGVSPAIGIDEVDGRLLVDVRTTEEFSKGTFAGAVNIPVDELRGRMSELPQAKPLAVFCQVGLRGYIAQQILRQSGFKDVVNLKGGYSLVAQRPRSS